jgi:hypothetical protein
MHTLARSLLRNQCHGHLPWLVLAAAACSVSSMAHACATCGCALSADAATGYSSATGWRMTFETDFIDQSQLRGGTSTATPAQVVNNPSDPELCGGEVERQTINRYVTLGISYSPTSTWNFNLVVPWVSRSHTTYGIQEAPFEAADVAPEQISGASVSGLGDVKLITSFQGLLPTHNLGLQLGIKLPTGDYGTHVKFESGPWTGEPLDASLQAGTGSTDLIIGAYYYQAISQNFDAFINGQYQAAIAHAQDEPGNDFKPGNSANISFGLRYEADPRWIPQLQINLTHKSADEGALADSPDTEGTVAYVSPGITVQVSAPLHVYGFVQVPVYSKLDGYQVFPHWTASLGAAYAF